MADIITLKDLKTDEAVYPRTHVSAVLDKDGTPIDTLLEIQNEKLSELALKTLGKVLSHEQTVHVGSDYLNADGTWTYAGDFSVCYFKVVGGDSISVQANDKKNALVAFVEGFDGSPLVAGHSRQTVPTGTTKHFIAPKDCYLYVVYRNGLDIAFPKSLKVAYDERIDNIESDVNDLKENEGRVRFDVTLNKFDIKQMPIYVTDHVLLAQTADVGKHIDKVEKGIINGSVVYKINLPQAQCTVKYPLIKSSSGTGCVVTDKKDNVVWAYYEETLDTGSVKTVELDEKAANFYLSVTPSLEQLDYSFNKKGEYQLLSLIESVEEDSDKSVKSVEYKVDVNILGEKLEESNARHIGKAYLNSDGSWSSEGSFVVAYHEVKEGDSINIEASNDSNSIVAFVKGFDNSSLVDGEIRHTVLMGTASNLVAPTDCYLYTVVYNGDKNMYPERMSVYKKDRIDVMEKVVKGLKENEGMVTTKKVYSKADISSITPYYTDGVMNAFTAEIGEHISSVELGGLTNGFIYKFELPKTKCVVTYPLIKTTSGTGCVATDKDDNVIWLHYETSMATGSTKTVEFGKDAAYFYLSVSPTLNTMDYSFVIEAKRSIADVVEGIGGSGSEVTLDSRKNTKVRWLPFKPSINGDKQSLCLAGIQFKIDNNKIPFQSAYLFHNMPDDQKIYIGTTLDNAEYLATVDYAPRNCVMALSPSGCVISVARDARGTIRVWNGENHTVNALSTDGLNVKPKGWLYNSGVEFIVDSSGTEHCLFAEYSGSYSRGEKMYVWKGTYPYTSPSDWKTVYSATTDYNDTFTAGTGGSVTHFHMVRRDPWTGILYLSSGDLPGQLQWWYSLDEGESWVLLASDGWDAATDAGYEEHCLRTINFIFTKDYIYWATDHGTNHTLNKVSRNAETGIIDTSTRVKLADLPYGQATNSLCYVESPNGLFLFERIDTGYPSYYSSPIKVLFWSFERERLETLIELKQLKADWGGHRGKCYFNYTNGAEPRPAMGFADNTRCPFDLIGSDENIGTIFYEL